MVEFDVEIGILATKFLTSKCAIRELMVLIDCLAAVVHALVLIKLRFSSQIIPEKFLDAN